MIKPTWIILPFPPSFPAPGTELRNLRVSKKATPADPRFGHAGNAGPDVLKKLTTQKFSGGGFQGGSSFSGGKKWMDGCLTVFFNKNILWRLRGLFHGGCWCFRCFSFYIQHFWLRVLAMKVGYEGNHWASDSKISLKRAYNIIQFRFHGSMLEKKVQNYFRKWYLSLVLLMEETTWEVQNLVNNGINYQPQLVNDRFLNHQQGARTYQQKHLQRVQISCFLHVLCTACS